MMKNFALLICALLLLNSCAYKNKKEAVNQSLPTSGITKKQADLTFDFIKDLPNETQISIAIVKDSDVIFYGIKRVNDSVININNFDSKFEIGSISKVFTATLLANLVVKEKIDLDDKINKVLPFQINNDTEISFKQLANHTSGLDNNAGFTLPEYKSPINPYRNFTEEKLERYLKKKLKVHSKPGQKYLYSTLGSSILGYTLSKLENKDYETMLNNKIFSKFKMQNTSSLQLKNKDIVYGIDYRGRVIKKNWDYGYIKPGGGIVSTVADLSKFVIAQFDSSNYELALTREKTFKTTINDNVSIGLGWFIGEDKSDTLYCHGGKTRGYSSQIIFDINKKRGIVILTNVSGRITDRIHYGKWAFELMKTIE